MAYQIVLYLHVASALGYFRVLVSRKRPCDGC